MRDQIKDLRVKLMLLIKRIGTEQNLKCFEDVIDLMKRLRSNPVEPVMIVLFRRYKFIVGHHVLSRIEQTLMIVLPPI